MSRQEFWVRLQVAKCAKDVNFTHGSRPPLNAENLGQLTLAVDTFFGLWRLLLRFHRWRFGKPQWIAVAVVTQHLTAWVENEFNSRELEGLSEPNWPSTSPSADARFSMRVSCRALLARKRQMFTLSCWYKKQDVGKGWEPWSTDSKTGGELVRLNPLGWRIFFFVKFLTMTIHDPLFGLKRGEGWSADVAASPERLDRRGLQPVERALGSKRVILVLVGKQIPVYVWKWGPNKTMIYQSYLIIVLQYFAYEKGNFADNHVNIHAHIEMDNAQFVKRILGNHGVWPTHSSKMWRQSVHFPGHYYAMIPNSPWILDIRSEWFAGVAVSSCSPQNGGLSCNQDA